MTDEPITPHLRFNGGQANGNMVGWNGAWPPPERLYAVSGVIAKVTSYSTQESLEAAAEAAGGMGVLAERLNITPYRLRTCSQLTDEEAKQVAPHVVRMAEYDEEL